MEVIQADTPGIPAVDIMVPTHNNVDLTKRCVQAIYFHTKSPFHLIVCDDSTDGLTPKYFEQLRTGGVSPLGKVANITYIHADRFTEGNHFFNTALRYCKSEYMATVMNSCRIEPEWDIFALQQLLPQNPDIGTVGFKCLFGGDPTNVGHIESAGIKMVKYLPTDIGRDLPGHRLTGVYECDAVQWAFALHRVKALRGNLAEGIFHGHRGWDDIDNCFAVKAKGWKIIYCGLGACYHEPRATRGSNTPEATKENRVNGEAFYKRWGLWEMFCQDNPEGSDLHTMPKEIKEIQDYQESTAFTMERE